MTTHKAIVEMLTKDNVKVLDDPTKVIKASEKSISESTTKVKKLYEDVTAFINEFRTTHDANTKFANKMI